MRGMCCAGAFPRRKRMWRMSSKAAIRHGMEAAVEGSADTSPADA
jgi:hypothetical protein